MSRLPYRAWIAPAVLTCVVVALWAFPRAWYSQRGSESLHWFAERREIPGWEFEIVPIDKSAEKALVADKTVNGEFTGPGNAKVRVFAANRYEEKSNEIGLFIHTPDRCWVETGWQLEAVAPDLIHLDVHGVKLPFERRIFTSGDHRELVYFSGLVGGEAVPYRLDHNLAAGLRTGMADDGVGGRRRAAGAVDVTFWQRLLTSFASRRQLLGPKQFIRISTPLRAGEDVDAADQRLQDFLGRWLVPAEYTSDKMQWKNASVSGAEEDR